MSFCVFLTCGKLAVKSVGFVAAIYRTVIIRRAEDLAVNY